MPNMYFTVEKARRYRPGERYNTGEGFEGSTDDRAQAELWFATFSSFAGCPRGHQYAVELRCGDIVLKTAGCTMAAARASLRDAVRVRSHAVNVSECD